MARNRLFPLRAAALGLAVYPQIAAAQCSMCRATLLTSPEARQLIAGLRQGVLILLAVPLIISVLVLRRLRQPKEKTSPVLSPSATKQ